MHDDMPTYLSNLTWAELLWQLAHNAELRANLSVKLCPFTGEVEDYMVADQLGGMLNIWPAKWRSVIGAGQALLTT